MLTDSQKVALYGATFFLTFAKHQFEISCASDTEMHRGTVRSSSSVQIKQLSSDQCANRINYGRLKEYLFF